jgi:photosystem II stability/assembly factor-like uncharacterized protein
MKRLTLILLVILASIHIIYSQSGWVRQYPGTNGALNSVHFVDINTGYIAGSPNLKTTNSGLNWSVITIDSINVGLSVFFVNANTGVIGSSNRLYKTTDSGLTWTYFIVTANPVWSVYFINGLTGWAAMGFQFNGKIYKTTNAGTSWYNTLTSSGIGSVHFANINMICTWHIW